MPKVSIIIPNYNNAKYLRDCFDSLLAQTFTDWEVIIIDDGSTDASARIIKKYAKRDPRIIPVFLSENGGISAARNAGLNIASGEYITFLDSDDFMAPYALTAMMDAAFDTGADLVGCPRWFVEEYSNPYGCNYPKYNYLDIEKVDSKNNPMRTIQETHHKYVDYKLTFVWSHLFKRELLNDVWFNTKIGMNEDLCFMLDVIYRVKRFVFINIKTVCHRKSETSVSNNGFNSNTFKYFPEILTHIYGLRSKYPVYWLKSFYRMFLSDIVQVILVTPVSKEHKYRQEACEVLARVYGTPVLPLKYLSIYNRIMLWLFVKSFKK